MGQTTQQGTKWESKFVQSALAAGRSAIRLAKTGKKNEPDLVIHPKNLPYLVKDYRPIVAWERWVGKKGKGRRRAVRMVTMTDEHFKELLDSSPYGYYVQCKSTQVGSLSAWLEGLIERLEKDEAI